MGTGRHHYEGGARIPGTVYAVIKLIGSGGMGTVYDVEDTTVGKRYVLKTLHADLGNREDLAKRMELEARSLARLSHPNIVEVVTAGVTADDLHLPFFVMERLNGQNLRVILSKRGSLELPHAIHIGIDLLDALEAAHDLQILHRDVKPDNIFLHKAVNNVTLTKLLDFGISRDTLRPGVTGDKFVGTLRYAAPEQLRANEVSVRSDLYAAGLVIYEMLAGRGPFDDASNIGEVAQAHMTRTPPTLAQLGLQVPPELEKLLRSALSKDPLQRPKDAFTFAAHLRNLKRKEERPFLNSDSRPTAVAIMQGLDTSKPPSPPPASPLSPLPPFPSPPPVHDGVDTQVAGAASESVTVQVALAPTMHAATRASTPEAKGPASAYEPLAPAPQEYTLASVGAPAYAAPSVPSNTFTPTRVQAPPVDRAALTQTAVRPLQVPVAYSGTQAVAISLAQPSWGPAVDAMGIRDTIREAVPAGARADATGGDPQLLVALPGPQFPSVPIPRTDGSLVRNVAGHPAASRMGNVVMAAVAAGTLVAAFIGTVALIMRARAHPVEGAAPAATALAAPTVATPLFDEIPSAAPAAIPPVPSAAVVAAADPATSASAPATAAQSKPPPLTLTGSPATATPHRARPSSAPPPDPLPPELNMDRHTIVLAPAPAPAASASGGTKKRVSGL